MAFIRPSSRIEIAIAFTNHVTRVNKAELFCLLGIRLLRA